MKKRLQVLVMPLAVLVLLAGTSCTTTPPQSNALAGPTRGKEADRLQWWRDARFGLFIHWGPVSLTGTEIGWSRGGERCGYRGRGTQIPVEVYDNLYRQFNPTNFHAREWVQLARRTGMKYMAFTAKHCDGFCRWPTKVYDYHIGNTPFRRDVVGELTTAAHGAGMRLGWYLLADGLARPGLPPGTECGLRAAHAGAPADAVPSQSSTSPEHRPGGGCHCGRRNLLPGYPTRFLRRLVSRPPRSGVDRGRSRLRYRSGRRGDRPLRAAIVAVDGSSAMCRAGRKRLAGIPHVEVRSGVLEALPIENGALDAATLVLVLHHVSEPARVLAVGVRALAPSGRLLVVDMLPHDREEYRRSMGHVWLGFSEQEMVRLLEDAGLHEVLVRPLPPSPRAKGPSLFAARGVKPRVSLR